VPRCKRLCSGVSPPRQARRTAWDEQQQRNTGTRQGPARSAASKLFSGE
jgi:hypothetical protein